MRIDLHCHSNCSDGTESPIRLARLGCASGIRVMALTDHDTAEGVRSFMKEAARLGMACLSGIEMSAAWPGTLHILGYGFDVDNPLLNEELAELRRCRDERNERMLSKLNDLGLTVTMDEVKKEAGPGVIGRPHFAKALVRRGFVRDLKEAFARYLGRGAPAFVVKRGFPPADCIRLIDRSGGKTVLAHPLQTAPFEELRPIVEDLKNLGLWGMECFSGHHDRQAAEQLIGLAEELGLKTTAGSDFHGANRPGYRLGVAVPPGIIDWSELGVVFSRK